MPEVAERAQQAQDAAQEKAQEAKREARGRLRDEVDTRSTEFGRQLSGTGEAVREAARQLSEKGQDAPARATEQAAQKMEQAGNWLAESDADRILGDMEDFARRQPWAVLAGGALLGFAASRFLKSSSSERYSTHQARSQSQQSPAQGGEHGALGGGNGAPQATPTSGSVPAGRGAGPGAV